MLFSRCAATGKVSLGTAALQEYDMISSPDINHMGQTQWFYFSVCNAIPGVRYKFNFINLSKPDSMFNYGMRPLMYSRRLAEEQQKSQGEDHAGRKTLDGSTHAEKISMSLHLPIFAPLLALTPIKQSMCNVFRFSILLSCGN